MYDYLPGPCFFFYFDFILPDIIAKYIEKIQHLPAFTVMHYEVDVV